MDASKVLDLLEQLDDEVDELEEALAPLLKTALAETSSKLPLLDKAKLYTLVTYAIESILFSYLRLHGIKAREHPVFTELTRVKHYFDKIKTTESPPTRTTTIDKAVAKRFLEPDLAAAEKSALQAAELRAKEKARAHIKFEELNKQIEDRKTEKKRKSETVDAEEEPEPADIGTGEDFSGDGDSDSGVKDDPIPKKRKSKKRRKVSDVPESIPNSGASSPGKTKKKDKKKKKKKKDKGKTKET